MAEEKRAKNQLKQHIREKNQKLILDTAEQVFAQQGLAKTTMQMIADQAGLPKANVHYYFRSKKDLLEAVLERILTLWLTSVGGFDKATGPKENFSRYISEKIDQTRQYKHASKVFAMALIGEEPFVLDFLRQHFVSALEQEKAIIDVWIKEGLMAPVSVEHLFISLWAMTQTYADFDAQIKILLDKENLENADYETGKAFIISMVLAACKID
ncbi:TetR family transcriptional regulator C-terminal domain-containing protein [Marinomonas epiphytica]